MPTIETRWQFLSYRAIILENPALRVTVLPELGGRIWSIIYKPQDRELLWHNPRLLPQRAPFSAVFDDVWCGGWEELFPTPTPGVINGASYPDHGEIWCLPWEATTDSKSDAASAHLSCDTPISAFHIQKRIILPTEEPRLEVTYLLQNPRPSNFPFIFTLHPAFAITPRCRIAFPPMTVDLDPTYPGPLAGVDTPFEWPHATRAGKKVDLRVAPPHCAEEVYFLYGRGFREGWCAVTDPAARLSYGIIFSPEVFASCWLFATYGGWRNHYVAGPEPSTSYPQQIERALENGTAASLPVGGRLETTVIFQVQEGPASVGGLAPDGRFREVPSSP